MLFIPQNPFISKISSIETDMSDVPTGILEMLPNLLLFHSLCFTTDI